MKPIRLFFLLFALALFPLLPAVEPGKAEILAIPADSERYPDAKSVLLYNLETIVYQADGLDVSIDEFYQKVLTETGRAELRELKFYYNTSYGKLEVPTLEVIKPDGRVISVDAKLHGKETISASQMSENIYDPAQKVLSVTLPELEIGDILHVLSKRTEIKARIPNVWTEITLLQSDIPVLHYEVRIDGPAARPLAVKTIKNEVPGTVEYNEEKAGDRIRYTWIARNVPQAIPEPSMPALYTAVQRLLVSTAKDWREISRWYYNLSRPRLDAVTPAIREKTAELIKNCKNDDEKIMALFQFVSQNIRYMGITAEAEAPGYEPHDVSMTFDRRYGVCRDKAALLVAMLELAGFKAYPVLFMAGDPKDSEVPNTYFNHAIACVERAPGDYQLMDPTYETTTELLPSTLSNMSYLVAKPEGETLLRSPVPPAAQNLLRIVTRAAVSPDGTLSGGSTFHFDGVNDQMYRAAFSRWQPEFRRQFFARQLKAAIPGAELKKLEITPADVRDMATPLSVELTFEAGNSLPAGGTAEFLLQTPDYGANFGAAGFVLDAVDLESRRYDLQLFSTCGITEEFTLELPPACRVLQLPSPGRGGTPNLLEWSREFSLEGTLLSGKKRFTVDSVEVKPVDYLKLKAALRELDAAERALPIARIDFAKLTTEELTKAFPGADSFVLDAENSYELQSATDWVRRHSERRRILNYAGVKNHSELRISYNPVWEEADIEATVTAPDGSIRKLGPEELNRMDAPGAGAAPRYPGAKILVASLPGVVPGAVVESSITLRVKGKPFFSGYTSLPDPAPQQSQKVILRPGSVPVKTSPAPFGVRELSDGKNRLWQMENLPAIPREPNAAPARFFAPTIFLSSGDYTLYARQLREALAARLAEPMPEVDRLAVQLLAEAKKPGDEIPIIRDWVAKRIRAAGPALNALPLTALSNPEVTLQSGYGNSADRALLLAALLKRAKVDFNFVAASDLAALPEELTRLGEYPLLAFGSLLLHLPGSDCYLNDTSWYAQLGAVNAENNIGLDLGSGRLLTITPRKGEATANESRCDIRLAADGSAVIDVINRYTGSGFESENRRYSEFTPELKKQYRQELAAAFSQSAVLEAGPEFKERDGAGVVAYRVRVPDFASASGSYLSFALPGFSDLAGLVRTAEKSRKTPVLCGDRYEYKRNYRITLPEGYRAVEDRPRRSASGEAGTTEYVCEFEPGKRVLRVEASLTRPIELIRPEEYGKLVALQEELSKLSSERVILTREAE